MIKGVLVLIEYTTVIIEMIHYSDDLPLMNYSEFIIDKLTYDYTYLDFYDKHKFFEVQFGQLDEFIDSVAERIPSRSLSGCGS